MSKERLEKAKLMAEMLRVETRLPHDFPYDLVDWLVEQAEQKQSLETAVDFYQSALRDADRRVQELENVNRVLKKANVGSERAKERLRQWIDELEIENEHYREALELLVKQETLGKDVKTGKTAVSYNGMIALKGLGVFEDNEYIVYGADEVIESVLEGEE